MKSFLIHTVLILVLCSTTCIAQRFSFIPELSLIKSQVDGDKLIGYHKTGVKIGIGTNYNLSDVVFLSIKGSFYNNGSKRSGPFQERLLEGSQMELNLKSIGIEPSFILKPESKFWYIGTGIVLHRIVDYDYNLVNNIIVGSQPVLETSTFNTNYLAYTAFIGITISQNYRLQFSVEKSLNSLLSEDFENISTLSPYQFSVGLGYEINPHVSKRSKRAKRRRDLEN